MSDVTSSDSSSPRMLVDWVILTMGDRDVQLAQAIESVLDQASTSEVWVVVNGGHDHPVSLPVDSRVHIVVLEENVGVPGGRHEGLSRSSASLVGFLDDDARITDGRASDKIVSAFAADPALGALALRLVDEDGETSRRHVPRFGAGGATTSGPVVNFLGGASVVRRSAYLAAGGYWPTLFYGHEEIDLAWRLADVGASVRYEATVTVFHPTTAISRHPQGWWRTGHNRVLVARRNLPLPLLLTHTLCWLALGTIRAPRGECRRTYLRGWRAGWATEVDRRPISWSTVLRLLRLGRPPIL